MDGFGPRIAAAVVQGGLGGGLIIYGVRQGVDRLFDHLGAPRMARVLKESKGVKSGASWFKETIEPVQQPAGSTKQSDKPVLLGVAAGVLLSSLLQSGWSMIRRRRAKRAAGQGAIVNHVADGSPEGRY